MCLGYKLHSHKNTDCEWFNKFDFVRFHFSCFIILSFSPFPRGIIFETVHKYREQGCVVFFREPTEQNPLSHFGR